MYRCPRLIEVPPVLDLPTVMYKPPVLNMIGLKDVTGTANSHRIYNETKGSPAVSALEARQEAVLSRLQTLKQQLDKLQSNRLATNTTNTTALGAAAHSSPVKASPGSLQEVVVSSSPSSPPLSLLLLRRLLSQAGLSIHSSSRLHSSTSSTPVIAELHKAFTKAPKGERTQHNLVMSLHWGANSLPSLMVNPLRQTKIEGEANIIRYFCRLFPSTSPYNYEATGNFSDIAEVDEVMDSLERECVWGGARGRQNAVKIVTARLAKSPFLLGNACGPADTLAWSLLRQGGQVKSSQRELVKWMAAMDDLADFDVSKILNHTTATTTTTTTATTTTTTTGKKEGEEKRKTEVPARGGGGEGGGGKHMRKEELEEYIKNLGINYEAQVHAPVFTVEEQCKVVRAGVGQLTKNLFLKDKKKSLYLLSAAHDKEINLKQLSTQLHVKDLRLADDATLLHILGVERGSVSPLSLVNDRGGVVTVLLDAPLLHSSTKLLHFHPLTNTATLSLTPDDLTKFVEVTGHKVTVVELN